MKFKCVNCGSLVGEDEGFFCHKCTKEMAAKNKLTVVTESKKEGETSGGLASPESKRGRSCVNDLAAEAPDSMNCVEKEKGGNE